MICVCGAETPEGFGMLKPPEEVLIGMVETAGLVALALPPVGMGMVEIAGLLMLAPDEGTGMGMVEIPVFPGPLLACGRTIVVGGAAAPAGLGKLTEPFLWMVAPPGRGAEICGRITLPPLPTGIGMVEMGGRGCTWDGTDGRSAGGRGADGRGAGGRGADGRGAGGGTWPCGGRTPGAWPAGKRGGAGTRWMPCG